MGLPDAPSVGRVADALRRVRVGCPERTRWRGDTATRQDRTAARLTGQGAIWTSGPRPAGSTRWTAGTGYGNAPGGAGGVQVAEGVVPMGQQPLLVPLFPLTLLWSPEPSQ